MTTPGWSYESTPTGAVYRSTLGVVREVRPYVGRSTWTRVFADGSVVEGLASADEALALLAPPAPAPTPSPTYIARPQERIALARDLLVDGAKRSDVMVAIMRELGCGRDAARYAVDTVRRERELARRAPLTQDQIEERARRTTVALEMLRGGVGRQYAAVCVRKICQCSQSSARAAVTRAVEALKAEKKSLSFLPAETNRSAELEQRNRLGASVVADCDRGAA